MAAVKAIEGEQTVDGVFDRLCKSLVFVVGATACSASRVAGDYLRSEPGSSDRRVRTANGCSGVLITSSRDRLL